MQNRVFGNQNQMFSKEDYFKFNSPHSMKKVEKDLFITRIFIFIGIWVYYCAISILAAFIIAYCINSMSFTEVPIINVFDILKSFAIVTSLLFLTKMFPFK